MKTIKSLENISFNKIYQAFSKAFADYEIQLNKDELQTMLTRRGFSPELSFGAFDGDQIISFTFNGIGTFNDKKTAYDTGTGTIKEYRGKGLATEIFNFSLPYLKKAGVEQYLLEVLQHNTKAYSIYKKIGFKVSREFNYFKSDIDKINISCIDNKYSIAPLGLDNKEKMAKFWDFEPSWQNSFESVVRQIQDFVILGAYDKNKLIGYIIFEPFSGDITQIAVDKNYRRQKIASCLINKALKILKFSSVKYINSDVKDTSTLEFLKSQNIHLIGKQFEMIKKL